jgi:hypothetical protein
MSMNPQFPWVVMKVAWMREQGIWPTGPRYLWTDAFGVLVMVTLYRERNEDKWLDEAEGVVAEVNRVLGRPVGLRIGEAPERGGQYYHYLAMWLFALWQLGAHRPVYRERAVALAREIHPYFVRPGVGIHWKMKEDLSGPWPGYGLGALDPFHGFVVYRLLDPVGLRSEIAELEALVRHAAPTLQVTQDLGLGMLLWMSHVFPAESWATTVRRMALRGLDRLWVDPPGYFCREPGHPMTRFAFTNFGIAIGLQAVGATPDRVRRLNTHFEGYRSGDEYDTNAITHVMACSARLPGALLVPSALET